VKLATWSCGTIVVFQQRRIHYVRHRVIVGTLCRRAKTFTFQLTIHIHPSSPCLLVEDKNGDDGERIGLLKEDYHV
jgi:hypothetical protein